MPVDVFIAVDGTGPSNDAEYRTAFANSFLRKLFSSGRFRESYYSRGPSLAGQETGALAAWAANQAMISTNTHAANGGARVFIGGYSRGGAAALEAAHLVRARGGMVHGLILFDAVDRTPTISNTTIPANVRWCRHAVRQEGAGSRTYFGNCGTQMERGVDALRNNFLTTHGGMGGTPFGATAASPRGRIHEMEIGSTARSILSVASRISPPVGLIAPVVDLVGETNITAAQEAAGSAAVWAWMSGQLSAFQART